MKVRNDLVFISLLTGLLFNASVRASDSSWFEPSDWEAFVSQSAIHTSDYDFLSRSDDTVSFDMWEAGVLFSTRVKGDLSFSAQLLGRKVSEYSDEDLRVDYGFFNYPFYQSNSAALGLRLGRIRSSYGFYNETRDIPHTRNGVIMPQAIYFDMTRNSFYSADGMEVYGFRDLGDQRLALQVFVSQPITDKDEGQEAYYLAPTDLEGDKSILVKLAYGSEIEGWRSAFTYYRPEYEVEVRFPVSETPLIIIDEDNASFYSENMLSSLEYNQLNWTLTAEYQRHKFRTKIPALSGVGESPVSALFEEAFYLQALYRFDECWSSFFRLERSRIRNGGYPSYESAITGVSFRPDQNWLMRAELHYVDGVLRLFKRDNPDLDGRSPYWTALMFQIAYKW